MVDAVAAGRLHRRVIDREGGDSNAATVVDDTVRNFDRTELCPCRGCAVVGLTKPNVEWECLTEMRRHAVRAARAPHGERPVPSWAHEPSRQPQVGKPNDVIRVEMSQQDGIDVSPANSCLLQALQGAPPRIDQEGLAAGLDERAWSKSLETRRWAAGSEEVTLIDCAVRSGAGNAAANASRHEATAQGLRRIMCSSCVM